MKIEASPMRRGVGVSTLWSLGLILLWLGATQHYERPLFQLVMLALGGLILWAGERLRRATRRSIILTETDLRDSDGRVIAELSDVVSVDRGAFAFKPSNGFLLRLRNPGRRHWFPGLWWRLGNRVGVGGVTSAGQTKAVAERISEFLMARGG